MPELLLQNTIDLILQTPVVEHVLLLAFASMAAAFCYLYLQQYHKTQKLSRDLNHLKDPDNKSLGVLHRALRKARSILGQAELESVKMTADSRYLIKKFEEEYEKQLSLSRSNLETTLFKEVAEAQSNFLKYLEALQTKSDQIQLENQQIIKQKMDETFQKFEQGLHDLFTDTEQKGATAVAEELKSARTLIDRYKTQQLSLIDENIIATLEKTLSLVLIKKISLKEETDLVFEALEKAKAENFII